MTRALRLACFLGVFAFSASPALVSAQDEHAQPVDVGERDQYGEHGEGEHGDGEHAEGEHADGEHAEGEHGAAHGGGHHGHFNFAHGLFGGEETPPFLANIINFLALCVILWFIARKPLGSFLTERKREIEEGLLESKRIKEQAETKHREYKERLSRLDTELAQLKKEIVAAGEKERDRIVADAEKTAGRMRRETEFLVEQEMKQLRIDLRREIVEESVRTAERVLRERVTADDQRRLADEYARMADKMLAKNVATRSSGGVS